LGGGQQGRFSGRGPKGYCRSDERIQEEINDQLTQHGDIDATEIMVKVSGGVVTLTGTVEYRNAKRMAEDVAESVSGVQVQNQIRASRSHCFLLPAFRFPAFCLLPPVFCLLSRLLF
jgi:osmotically-inducible protein OsmY